MTPIGMDRRAVGMKKVSGMMEEFHSRILALESFVLRQLRINAHLEEEIRGLRTALQNQPPAGVLAASAPAPAPAPGPPPSPRALLAGLQRPSSGFRTDRKIMAPGLEGVENAIALVVDARPAGPANFDVTESAD
jgi:hypothetical protein